MSRNPFNQWARELKNHQGDARSSWFIDTLQPAVLALAAGDYAHATPSPMELVNTTIGAFTYQFDVLQKRAVLACGVVTVPARAARDKSRMAGYPSTAGQEFDRGHLIPHSAGSGTEINLFLQLARVNRREFRQLERKVMKQPGSFYLVRLFYDGANDGQVPDVVEQCLFPLAELHAVEWRQFDNHGG